MNNLKIGDYVKLNETGIFYAQNQNLVGQIVSDISYVGGIKCVVVQWGSPGLYHFAYKRYITDARLMILSNLMKISKIIYPDE